MSDGNARTEPRPGDPAEDTDMARAVLDDLEVLRGERDKFLDLLRRTQADFENYQKRNQRERDQERRYAHGGFAADLLPVIDNLDRAAEAAKQAGETGHLVEGVNIVLDQLLNVLKRHGITRMDAQGKPFD